MSNSAEPESEHDQDSWHVGRERPRSRITLQKPLIAVGLLIFIGIIVYDFCKTGRIKSQSEAFFSWVESHPTLGVLAVVFVYIVATICFIPGSLLTIGTGYAFRRAFDSFTKGLLLASVSVFLGAFLGSISSFLLGRYLLREWVVRLSRSYPLFQAVDRALENNGLKIMILLRLSPLIPYNALDYVSGVTSISLKEYSLALFGILPGTVMFCAIGATASSFTDGAQKAESGSLQKFVIVFGLLFAIIGVMVASHYSKIELDKILNEGQSETTLLTDDAPEHLEITGRQQDEQSLTMS